MYHKVKISRILAVNIFLLKEISIGEFSINGDYLVFNLENFSEVNISQVAEAREIMVDSQFLNKTISYSCTCMLEFCGSGALEGYKGETNKNISSIEKDKFYVIDDKNTSGWRCYPSAHLNINEQSNLLKEKKNYKIYKNFLYFGTNPKHPKKGDMRITYYELRPQIYSVLGIQRLGKIERYVFDNTNIIVFLKGNKSLKLAVEKLVSSRYKKSDKLLFSGALFFILAILFFIRNKIINNKK